MMQDERQNKRPKNIVVLDKKVGETPLECLERYRVEMLAADETRFTNMPMTYAGRLDPMAEGKLLVLISDECKNRDYYLGLDKTYEIEVLFGLETDTQDVLGKIEMDTSVPVSSAAVQSQQEPLTHSLPSLIQKYIGKFSQKYPVYSSKAVAGKALHTYAREGILHELAAMPERMVEIYLIDIMGTRTMNAAAIAAEILEKIALVKGDFRQDEIVAGWKQFGQTYGATDFTLVRLQVACSSGTYMRTLAKDIGIDVGIGAIAYSIRRTKIGEYSL